MLYIDGEVKQCDTYSLYSLLKDKSLNNGKIIIYERCVKDVETVIAVRIYGETVDFVFREDGVECCLCDIYHFAVLLIPMMKHYRDGLLAFNLDILSITVDKIKQSYAIYTNMISSINQVIN